MEAIKTKLENLFTGDDTSYIIPVYQRNYSWTSKQCKQLFQDLLSIIETDREHFFGSVVLCHIIHNSWSVIDGQQRLTTVSLIWLAMAKLIKDGVKQAKSTLTDNIHKKFSYESLEDGSIQPRMVHVEKDRNAFAALIEDNEEAFEKDSYITQNFHLFYEWMKNSKYSLVEFYNAIKNLMMVKIEVDTKDKPQLIFESLNSTGLALTDGDKIRNFILMNLEPNLQKAYYKNYWIDIEKYSNYSGNQKDAQEAVTLFVRDYMTAQTTKIPVLRDVYFKFKEFTNHKGLAPEKLLGEMKTYSRYLFEIENAATKSSKLNLILKRLALLEMTVCHPFEFKLLDSFYSKEIDEEELCKVLVVVESYIFRRLICDVPTNALNKIFASLYDSAEKLVQKANIPYYEAVCYLLTSRNGSGRFPSDKEFMEALATKNIYKMRAKNKIYTFYRLNAGNNAEGDTSVIDKMLPDENGNVILSIEHVMPQTLNVDWKKSLGGEQKAIRLQEIWEHTIANLTLTGYNSSYSNSSFMTKLTLQTESGLGIGFKYSPLHINEFIKQQTSWGEKQLEARLSEIQREAIEIWKLPISKYKPAIKEAESLTLEDESEDFTNTVFIDCNINGEQLPIKQDENWINAFIGIMKFLYREYKFDIQKIANDDSLTFLQNETTKYQNSVLIFDGVYAYLKSSTAVKIDILKDVFNELSIEQDALVFHIKRIVGNE